LTKIFLKISGEALEKKLFYSLLNNFQNFIVFYVPTETVVTNFKILKENDKYKNIGK
jgi:hypothetical protein